MMFCILLYTTSAIIVNLIARESSALRTVDICSEQSSIIVNKTLEASPVYIVSPNRTNSNETTNVTCTASIRADGISYHPGYNVLLIVRFFNLSGQDPCSPHQEHLTITFSKRESNCSEDNVVDTVRWCGQSYTRELLTRQDMVLTYYAGPEENRGQGFDIRLSFEKIDCPQYTQLSVGSQPMYLYSPGYPDLYYVMRLFCTWHISTVSRRPLLVESLRFSLEDHVSCKYDYIAITTDINTKKKYCGDQRVRTVSQNGQATLTLRTDHVLTKKGFILKLMEATSDFDACNREVMVSGSPSIFHVPSPEPSNRHTNCWWLFNTGSADSVVLLDTTNFQTGIDCLQFKLWLYDGRDSKARTIVSKCTPQQMFQTVRSSSQYLYLEIEQDSYVYEPISVNFTVSASPRDAPPRVLYAGFAPSHVWLDLSTYQDLGILIRGAEEAADNYSTCIQMRVKGFPQLSVIGISYLSTTDFFYAFSGFNETAAELGHACGRNTSTRLISRGSKMLLRFFKTLRTNFHQIWLNYVLLDQRECQPDTVTFQTSADRMYILESEHVRCFANGENHGHYPNNAHCRWVILPISSAFVTEIRVRSSQLHKGKRDNITVYDYLPAEGSSPQNQLLHWSSNETLTAFSSRGKGLLVEFITDSWGTGRGFNLTYSSMSLDEKCPRLGPLTAGAAFQELTSPNYPNNYPNNLDCKWRIVSHVGVVNLTLIDVSLAYGTIFCSLNNEALTIYDGWDENSPVLKQVCQSGWKSMQSSGSYVLIHFRSGNFKSDRGFKLKYKATRYMGIWNCNRDVVLRTDQQVLISSPSFPGTYPFPSDGECYWVARGPSGALTSVNIISLLKRTCLEIHDGELATDPLLKVICSPQVYTSTSNVILIKLQPNRSIAEQKFAFYVKSFYNNGCRDKLLELEANSSEQYLQSPGYPNKYPGNSHCNWRIHSKDRAKVVLMQVMEVKLEKSNGCFRDYVIVFDGYSADSPVLKKLCSHTESLASTGNYMYVQFVSDGSLEDRGFSLAYRAVLPSDVQPPGNESHSYGTIVGSVLGGIGILVFFIFFILFLYCVRRRKLAQTQAPASPAQRQTSRESRRGDTVYFMSPVIINQMAPPPPYSAVSGPGSSPSRSAQSPVTLPPSYDEMEAPPSYSEYMLDSFPPSSPGLATPGVGSVEASTQLGEQHSANFPMRSSQSSSRPAHRSESAHLRQLPSSSAGDCAKLDERDAVSRAETGESDVPGSLRQAGPVLGGPRHGGDAQENSSSPLEHVDSYSRESGSSGREEAANRAPPPQGRQQQHHCQQGQTTHEASEEDDGYSSSLLARMDSYPSESASSRDEAAADRQQLLQCRQLQQDQTRQQLSETSKDSDGYGSSLLARMDSYPSGAGQQDPSVTSSRARGHQPRQQNSHSQPSVPPGHHPRWQQPQQHQTPPPAYEPRTPEGRSTEARSQQPSPPYSQTPQSDDGRYQQNSHRQPTVPPGHHPRRQQPQQHQTPPPAYQPRTPEGRSTEARSQLPSPPYSQTPQTDDGRYRQPPGDADDSIGYSSNLLARVDSLDSNAESQPSTVTYSRPQARQPVHEDNEASDGYASSLLSRMDSYPSSPGDSQAAADSRNRGQRSQPQQPQRQLSEFTSYV